MHGNLEKKSLKNFADICEFHKCTGCSSCFSACPCHCISMIEDSFGFLHPVIDKSICINCNLCKKTCPSNYSVVKNEPLSCFAARNKDNDERSKSTSGGLSFCFISEFLKKDGIVYCTIFDSSKKRFSFQRFDSRTFENTSDTIRGSKYTQALIGDAFINLKNDLDQGNKVLFISIPCQVAGLLSYLGKEYQELTTIDIVCHGVPSQKMLFDHIHSLNIPENRISNIIFRKGPKYNLNISDESDKAIYSANLFHDKYLEGFLSNMSLRLSCYHCQYASKKRIGDITLGDFWGLTNDSLRIEDGVNLVLINTEKGRKLFKLIVNRIEAHERSTHEAIEGNSQLCCPAQPHPHYLKFRKYFLSMSFDESISKSRKLRTRLRYLPFINKVVEKRYK